MPGEFLLQLHGVTKHFAAITALDRVDFGFRRGEIHALLGENGAGKSTLIKVLGGIHVPEASTIEIEGRPVRIRSVVDADRHGIRIIHQELSLAGNLTVAENIMNAGILLVPEDRKREGLVAIQSVAFNLALPWVREWITACVPSWCKRRQIVQRAIRGFGIRAADPEQCVADLSGGNQQKVLVGRWMERHPKVLILDEPTRGVDVGAREEMFSIISSLVEAGVAVVLISSDLAEVLNMSHRVALVRDGRIPRTAAAGEMTLESVIAELTGAEHDEIG